MFLPVRRAPCSDALNILIQVATEVLSYAIETLTPTLDIAAFEMRLQPEFRYIVQYIDVRRGMEAIFELPHPVRVKAYQAFCNDMCFEQHTDDDQYCFYELPPEASNAINQLCKGLYGIVKKGNLQEFNLRILQSQYTQENGENGKVCPVCVREILFDAGEGAADHYFPRTKYPALTLHPHNIVPICSDCNGARLKHAKDPISSQDAGPGELRTVFLPYLRPAQSEVAFCVSADCTRKIIMYPKEDTSEHTEKRIENMERLFKLGERWSLVLNNVYDDLIAELSEATVASLPKEEQIKNLRRLLRIHQDSTKNRMDFIKGVYCGWLNTKNDQELADMLLHSTLNLELDNTVCC